MSLNNQLYVAIGSSTDDLGRDLSVQNISSVALAPWLLLPVVAVVITMLAFNFMGDGLRDAAAPLCLR